MTATLFERIGGHPGLQRLLHHFYADVRQHSVIGSIFHAQIQDWPAHLEKIADFWSGILGGPAQYSGAMPSKHIPLDLEEQHFQAWLTLWYHNCRAQLPPAEAEEMIAIANKIGDRLRAILAHFRSQ